MPSLPDLAFPLRHAAARNSAFGMFLFDLQKRVGASAPGATLTLLWMFTVKNQASRYVNGILTMELRWLQPFTAEDKSAFDHIIQQSGVDVNNENFFPLWMVPVEEHQPPATPGYWQEAPQPSTLPPAPPGYNWWGYHW